MESRGWDPIWAFQARRRVGGCGGARRGDEPAWTWSKAGSAQPESWGPKLGSGGCPPSRSSSACRSAMSAPPLRTLQLLLLLGATWARAGAPRCTYTFVLPQQKFTGAVCWSGPSTARPAAEAVNASEVAALRMRVGRHEELLRELQRLAAADGAVAGEVRALRKESRGLSARLGQLRAQLQHEAGPGAGPGPGAEPAALLALLGERVLNVSAEAQRAAARFHQLDVKFRELAQLVTQQSGLIARLERLCPGGTGGQQQVTSKLARSRSHFLCATFVRRGSCDPTRDL